MRGCDAVVLPISFTEKMRHLTDFNIATKMSECLASGTPTLIVGPERAAMIRQLRPHSAALFHTDPSPEALSPVIARLRDPGIRQRLLLNASRLVRDELSTNQMRRRWHFACRDLNDPNPS